MIELITLKMDRESGKLSREQYWRQVQTSLTGIENLAPLLEYSNSTLTVERQGVILNYPITPDKEIRFFVDVNDTRSIGVSVISEGRYEPLLESTLLEISRGCSGFADIGANAGFYAISVGVTNPDCNVWAFECNPEIRGYLLRNIQLNGLSQIHVRPEGVSDFPSEAELFVPAFTGSGGGSLRDLHPDEGEAKRFTVSLITLDSLELKNLDLMKVDVEGAELGVVRGGLMTINLSKPTIFVELLRKWMKPFGSAPSDVFELLSKMGYVLFEIFEDHINEVSEIAVNTSATNFVFAHPSREKHLQVLRSQVAKS